MIHDHEEKIFWRSWYCVIQLIVTFPRYPRYLRSVSQVTCTTNTLLTTLRSSVNKVLEQPNLDLSWKFPLAGALHHPANKDLVLRPLTTLLPIPVRSLSRAPQFTLTGSEIYSLFTSYYQECRLNWRSSSWLPRGFNAMASIAMTQDLDESTSWTWPSFWGASPLYT